MIICHIFQFTQQFLNTLSPFLFQDILKTISLAVNLEDNGLAWERLGGASKRRKCVTLMITVLENAGLLLPEVVHENKEVTVTSPNICKFMILNNNKNLLEMLKLKNI